LLEWDTLDADIATLSKYATAIKSRLAIVETICFFNAIELVILLAKACQI
jgi:hypothetical protein